MLKWNKNKIILLNILVMLLFFLIIIFSNKINYISFYLLTVYIIIIAIIINKNQEPILIDLGFSKTRSQLLKQYIYKTIFIVTYSLAYTLYNILLTYLVFKEIGSIYILLNIVLIPIVVYQLLYIQKNKFDKQNIIIITNVLLVIFVLTITIIINNIYMLIFLILLNVILYILNTIYIIKKQM